MAADEPWAVEDLCVLCALATEVRGHRLVLHERSASLAAQHLSRVERWDLEAPGSDALLQTLLRFPRLRRVGAQSLGPHASAFFDQAPPATWSCPWHTLAVRQLGDLPPPPHRMPKGVGRVVVTEQLTCGSVWQVAEALRQQGWRPLCVQAHHPPSERAVRWWHLAGSPEQGKGFFVVEADGEQALARHASLLQRTVLAQGRGPHTLELKVTGSGLVSTLRRLAPLLAGTRVRTLCMTPRYSSVSVGGLLGALPASVAHVRLLVYRVESAREVLSGPAAAHPLRLVLLFPRACIFDGERELRELCAARQPLVHLQVLRQPDPARW